MPLWPRIGTLNLFLFVGADVRRLTSAAPKAIASSRRLLQGSWRASIAFWSCITTVNGGRRREALFFRQGFEKLARLFGGGGDLGRILTPVQALDHEWAARESTLF